MGSDMEDKLSAHECKALKMLGDHPTEFRVEPAEGASSQLA